MLTEQEINDKANELYPFESKGQDATIMQYCFKAGVQFCKNASQLTAAEPIGTLWREIKRTEREPTKEGFYYVLFNNGLRGNDWFRGDIWYSSQYENQVTHWLEKVKTTPGEAERKQVAEQAWDAAIDYASENLDWSISKNAIVDKETYLKAMFGE